MAGCRLRWPKAARNPCRWTSMASTGSSHGNDRFGVSWQLNLEQGPPSSRFQTARQYWPVASMAISVTGQLFNQPRNCRRSRVKVPNFRLLIPASGLPDGANMQTLRLFLCTPMPQHRRCLAVMSSTPGDRSPRGGRLEYRFESCHSYACSTACAAITIPGSNNVRVQTRFTNGLPRAPNALRPLVPCWRSPSRMPDSSPDAHFHRSGYSTHGSILALHKKSKNIFT